MSDQEATAPAPSSDERPQPTPQPQQQRTTQHERGGHRERGRRRNSPNQPQHQPQRRPERALNLEELRELVELIAQYGFTDFELEREGIRVRLRRDLAPQTTAAEASTPTLQPPPPPPAPVAPPVLTLAQAQQSASPAPAAQPSVEPAKAAAPEEELHIIPSPIVGTFYRSPSPTAEPFVRLGSHVNHDTVVCIIEAMKLMNEIQAETSGEVAKIYVENGQPVEYGQPLFGIKK